MNHQPSYDPEFAVKAWLAVILFCLFCWCELFSFIAYLLFA